MSHAKAAAKETQIAGKLAFNVDDKQLSLLASAAEFKDGEFQIQIPGQRDGCHEKLNTCTDYKQYRKIKKV